MRLSTLALALLPAAAIAAEPPALPLVDAPCAPEAARSPDAASLEDAWDCAQVAPYPLVPDGVIAVDPAPGFAAPDPTAVATPGEDIVDPLGWTLDADASWLTDPPATLFDDRPIDPACADAWATCMAVTGTHAGCGAALAACEAAPE